MTIPKPVLALIVALLIGLSSGAVGAYVGWLHGYTAGVADPDQCVALDSGPTFC